MITVPKGRQHMQIRSKPHLSLARLKLLEMVPALGFGVIEGLQINDSEPSVDSFPTVREDIRIAADSESRPETDRDFELQSRIADRSNLLTAPAAERQLVQQYVIRSFSAGIDLDDLAEAIRQLLGPGTIPLDTGRTLPTPDLLLTRQRGSHVIGSKGKDAPGS
jgi:hypothetical protein